MDAKCNRLIQSESGKVLNAKKSLLLHLSWSHAGWGDKTLHSLLELGWIKSFFSCDARFVQNTTKGIHSGYLVSKSVHPKMYWLQDGSFVDRCGARKFHSLHLHFEISFISLYFEISFFLSAFWNITLTPSTFQQTCTSTNPKMVGSKIPIF